MRLTILHFPIIYFLAFSTPCTFNHPLTNCESIILVVFISNGWTRFMTTTITRLLMCGKMLSNKFILGWCNSPCQLCDDNDDNNDFLFSENKAVKVKQFNNW